MTDEIDDEIVLAGYEIGELLTSALLPHTGGWETAQRPRMWQHNALCWLWRNFQAGRATRMNAWIHNVITDGYPFKPFIDYNGYQRPAGYYWNNTMPPLPNGARLKSHLKDLYEDPEEQ